MQLLLSKSRKSVNAALDVSLTTPLQYAAEENHLEVVKLLIKYNGDVCKKQRFTKYSALHCAIENDADPDLVDLLLKKGGKPDLHNRVSISLTREVSAIHMAVYNARLYTIRLLLDRGAHVDARTYPDDMTPLMVAASEGSMEAVELLIEGGAEIDAVDIDKETALHAAARKGNANIVQLCLDRGLNVSHMAGSHGSLPYECGRTRCTLFWQPMTQFLCLKYSLILLSINIGQCRKL